MFLPKPITEKETLTGGNLSLEFWKSEMQGWRVTMEDGFVANPQFDSGVSLFCIFDGHGGREVAKFCQDHFESELKRDVNYKIKDYKRALRDTFLKMDEIMLSSFGKNELKKYRRNNGSGEVYSGSTALVVLITEDTIYVANAGDCRCLLFREDGNILIMNEEHKPTTIEEERRIYRGGGVVINGRINDILNLSRAIGDFEYKSNFLKSPEEQVISAEPDVIVKKIEPEDSFLLLGCDGVFERLTDVQLRNLVFDGYESEMNMLDVTNMILDQTCAPEMGITTSGYDNMSAILIRLKKR